MVHGYLPKVGQHTRSLCCLSTVIAYDTVTLEHRQVTATMKLIFQIAAGIIIAILASNILLNRSMHNQMAQYEESARHSVKLLNGANITSSMANRYVKSHNKLPRYASDLDCSHRGFVCPVVAEDGAFYVVEGEQWVRQALYLQGGKVKAKCSSTDKTLLTEMNRYWGDCKWEENPKQPVFLSARYSCDASNRSFEKRICQSDRLVAADWAVENTYREVLSRADEDLKVRLISDQKQKLKFDLVDCKKDDACIESVLWQRFAELQVY